MRLIVEGFGRAWVLELMQAKLVDPETEQGEPEFEQAPPIDPHGAHGCQIEHGPGADAYLTDIMASATPVVVPHVDFSKPSGNPLVPVRRGFGFSRGSQE